MADRMKTAQELCWVPVAEGLPQMHGEVYEGLGDNGEDVTCLVSDPVLGFTDEGRYVVVKTGPVEWQRENLWWDEEGTTHKVTHWMELPGVPGCGS